MVLTWSSTLKVQIVLPFCRFDSMYWTILPSTVSTVSGIPAMPLMRQMFSRLFISRLAGQSNSWISNCSRAGRWLIKSLGSTGRAWSWFRVATILMCLSWFRPARCVLDISFMLSSRMYSSFSKSLSG